MKKAIGLLLISMSFYGCEDNAIEQPCLVPATIRDITGLGGCGFVFELEDGTHLEPIRLEFFCGTPELLEEVKKDPLYNFEFEDGKRVLISYDEDPRASICMAGINVKINCISEVDVTSSEN